MNKIQPITTLRDTAKIEKELKGSSEPIILTKNGYPALVVLSPEQYENLQQNKPIFAEKSITLMTNQPDFCAQQDHPLGMVKVRAASVKIHVAESKKIKKPFLRRLRKRRRMESRFWFLPELCLTGYTCGDLFFSKVDAERKWRSNSSDCALEQRPRDLICLWGAFSQRQLPL
jgi:hypothetical protein